MLQWIKVFYSNQAVLDTRKMKVRYPILLYFVLILFISIPAFFSLYMQKSSTYLPRMENFSVDLAEMLKENDCVIDGKLTCVVKGDRKWEGSKTTFHFVEVLPETTGKNEVYFTEEIGVVIDKDGKSLAIGYYDNFGKYDFQDLSAQLEANQIQPDDLATMFIRNLNLSSLLAKFTFSYFMQFIQYTVYVLVIAFLFKFMGGRKEEKKIKFSHGFTMMINLMLAPAMVCAAIGMFSPATAAMILPFAFVIRIIFLYYGVMRGKLKLSHPEVVS